MICKIVLLSIVLVFTTAYEQEGNIIVLHDSDFPQVFQNFPSLFIEFYAPWCGYCQSLQPIYIQLADKLKQMGLSTKLAHVDATVQTEIAKQYNVEGYPTLIYFKEGQEIYYNGETEIDLMFSWLKKKTTDPVIKITFQEYKNISSEKGNVVSIVFHGDIQSSQGKILANISQNDNYNNYYHISGSEKPQNSVEIIRPFGQAVMLQNFDENLKKWIQKNDRPLILPFDDRTLSAIFQEEKDCLVLSNSMESQTLSQIFASAVTSFAEINSRELIFTELMKSNQIFDQLIQYLKLDENKHIVILISLKENSKYVLTEVSDYQEMTEVQILKFLTDWNDGILQKYDLNNDIEQKEGFTDQQIEEQQQEVQQQVEKQQQQEKEL